MATGGDSNCGGGEKTRFEKGGGGADTTALGLGDDCTGGGPLGSGGGGGLGCGGGRELGGGGGGAGRLSGAALAWLGVPAGATALKDSAGGDGLGGAGKSCNIAGGGGLGSGGGLSGGGGLVGGGGPGGGSGDGDEVEAISVGGLGNGGGIGGDGGDGGGARVVNGRLYLAARYCCISNRSAADRALFHIKYSSTPKLLGSLDIIPALMVTWPGP